MCAASELGKITEDTSVVAALLESARNDPFWSVRKAAIEGLGAPENKERTSVLKKKCLDRNSQVRAAALKALGDSKQVELAVFFAERFEKDNSYVAQAETLKAIGKSGDGSFAGFLDDATRMTSPKDILKKAAEWASKQINSSVK